MDEFLERNVHNLIQTFSRQFSNMALSSGVGRKNSIFPKKCAKYSIILKSSSIVILGSFSLR